MHNNQNNNVSLFALEASGVGSIVDEENVEEGWRMDSGRGLAALLYFFLLFLHRALRTAHR